MNASESDDSSIELFGYLKIDDQACACGKIPNVWNLCHGKDEKQSEDRSTGTQGLEGIA
ncbi:MAG: hypothetical protein KGS48_11480 [Bacteroidetes bacterium]|nr:hypothetical protein [Bacteroidota bacterium]